MFRSRCRFIGAGHAVRPIRAHATTMRVIRSVGVETQPVHSDACGKHVILGGDADVGNGPSPRVWGAFLASQQEFDANRSIPTHVGSIRTRLPPHASSTVHPHACGEHEGIKWNPSHNRGPSPRVWGASSRGRRGEGIERSIPTRVGSIFGGGFG